MATAVVSVPPNNRMERGAMDKVLRRERDRTARKIFMRARVRDALARARSCERYAAGAFKMGQ